MTSAAFPPVDQPARATIAAALGQTLFVEAGAGSGKTSALVGRVVELVTSGTAELRAIAAITFTDKAAAELRDRLRQKLEHEADAGAPAIAERCRVAVDQLDGAAIGTLHAFAQRLLAEHPIEVGLPPRIEVQDEVSSDVEFERRWSAFLDGLLEDPDMERTLLLLFAAGVRPQALRAIAVEFDRNWDLVEHQVPADAPEPPRMQEQLAGALDLLRVVCRHVAECSDPGDPLAVRLGEVADYVARLEQTDDEIDLLTTLADTKARPSFAVGNRGRKGNWDDVAAVRAALTAAGEGLDEVVGQVAQACAHRLGSALRRFTLRSAEERCTEGALVFHDLLVLARRLVTTHAEARTRLHQRYRHLLLDEFQDTDPIQIDIAVRIAAAHPERPETGALHWHEVEIRPGHLFLVGDPKQSIYRFRRADVSLFLAARRRFGADGGLVTLSTNFRTGAPVIEWVNRAFAALMGESPEVETPTPSQPDYVDLHPVRPAPPVGPAVSVISRDVSQKISAPDLRTEEAERVAATIARIVGEGWSVGTGDDGDPWRPASLGDITVLVPARTSLPFLEDALDTLAIPYRAESSSLVYASQAIRDLFAALRAIDDPTDHLSIVSALRTPLFGCGDDDLFTFKVTDRGHWNYLAPQAETVGSGPVVEALAYLRRLHRDRHWRSPAELADQVVRDRRLFELGFAEGRTRDVWRRLRFVLDQAREWGEATNGGLRDYLLWVARQTSEGSRVAEAVLPETDDDAVRIMTIHAAKGLEFPVTILSGMSTVPQARPAAAQVAFPSDGNVGYKFGANVVTDEFVAWKPVDEQMGYDERIRLLYVATTRAKDHLVLSLQRKERKKDARPSKRTNAELLLAGTETALDDLPDAVDPHVAPVPLVTVEAPPMPVPFEQWEAERAEALRRGARPTTVAATALSAEGAADVADGPVQLDLGLDRGTAAPAPTELDPGLEKRARDLDLPPWLKGRYGTAVGRAVHGTLQTVDLADPVDLDAAVAAQCEAEAISDRVPDVTALTRAALEAPVVRAAAGGAVWREVYACTPTAGGRLLEGYIDLLYRTDHGLVVVDYKTAATNDPEELARRVAGYRLQGASYALAVRNTTGEPIARVVFLFLTLAGAVELDLPDVDAAIAEVEGLVARGAELVVG